jgi:hypothetical protein
MEAAVDAAAMVVRDAWPLAGPVPPRLLWENTVAHAARMAVAVFTVDEITQADTHSWTEVPFGGAPSDATAARALPWGCATAGGDSRHGCPHSRHD